MLDEGKLALKFLHELVVRGDQLTAFPFRQGHVKAVVDARATLRSNFESPGSQVWQRSMNRRQGRQKVGEEED